MKSVVLIGGPADGTLVAMHDDAPPYFEVLDIEPNHVLYAMPDITRRLYRPTKWKADKRFFEIWALDGMTADDIFERLLFKATIAAPACPMCNVAASCMEVVANAWVCAKCGYRRDT